MASKIFKPTLLPSGKLTQLWKMAIDIVSFPIKNGDLNSSYVNLYQRVPRSFSLCEGIQ